jgi:hypothetical protein
MSKKNPRLTPYLLTIEEMQEAAKEKGGKCLSPVYANSKTKLKWQCKEGHIWEATPANIRTGYWCAICAKEARKGIKIHNKPVKKLSLEDCYKLAEEKEGKLLSTEYINNVTKMIWQCKAGHQFKIDVAHVKRGQWCSICSHRESIGKALNVKKEIKKLEKYSPEKVVISKESFEYKHLKLSSELIAEIEKRAKINNLKVNEYIEKSLLKYIQVYDILTDKK